jgi:hypothetical protein
VPVTQLAAAAAAGYGQMPLPPNGAGIALPPAPPLVTRAASGLGGAPSNSYGSLPGAGAPAAAASAVTSNAYGALPGAPNAHASEYGSTPTGNDVDASAQPPAGSYGQLPSAQSAPAPAPAPGGGRGLVLPPIPGAAPAMSAPAGRPGTPPGTPMRRQAGGAPPPAASPGGAMRGSPRISAPPARNVDLLVSPMRLPPPSPGRPPPPAATRAPPALRMPGGPPAEPDEPPIGSFALDHLPPAQMDDFSRSAGGGVPGTDSETMAALNARKLRTNERSSIDQQPWYFSTIMRDDAAALIVNLPPGAFVVRTSSQPNSYALTFKHKSGEIQHGLLREGPQGWSIENAPPFELTLETLLKTHNGLNYNLVPQVRNAYAQKMGAAPLVAHDEYPVPDSLLAAANGGAPPAPRRPSTQQSPTPSPALPPAPFGAQRPGAAPAPGMARGPPPLVTSRSQSNLGGGAANDPTMMPRSQSTGKKCEICAIGRAVSRVKIGNAGELKLCCQNCLDMHIASPLRAQLAERRMAIDVIERQFGSKPKDKVALHQLMQIAADIATLEEQLEQLSHRK